jgi:hypothetical protein
MAWLPLVLQVVGTAVTVMSAIKAGQAQKAMNDFEAEQLNAQGAHEKALADKQALEERRKAKLLESKATAQAVAGGATATDPGVLDITTDIAQEGEYNALMALWEGEERAKGRYTQAAAARMEGREAKRAAKTKAISTAISGAGSAYSSWTKL